MKYLVTGGCGFLGTNLAKRIINQGDELIIIDALSRTGSTNNLGWLQKKHSFTFIQENTQRNSAINNIIGQYQPDVVFHTAGHVSLTNAINNPRLDAETNARGTFNILEAIRNYSPETILIYSSSSKIYGDLTDVTTLEKETRYFCPEYPYGFDETLPIKFQTPHSCSKGTADQYIMGYAQTYDLRAVVLRHSTIYGSRQFCTYDQGWIGWFCQQALATKNNPSRPPFTINGNGKQVRDILFVDDAVDIYFAALENIDTATGHAFNIGGGMNNSVSIIELLNLLENLTSTTLKYKQLPWRTFDQKVFVSNNAKATTMLGWKPQTTYLEGLTKMIEWMAAQQKARV